MWLVGDRHAPLLTAAEHERARRYRLAADRARFMLATALLRVAAGAWLGRPPVDVVVDRSCEHCRKPHGRPRLPGTSLHASISHSGGYVAVALSDAGAVGIDIERIDSVAGPPPVDAVCAPAELAHVARDSDFYTYWTRKESILKATGAGLRVPMRRVVVTPPDRHPRVLEYECAALHAQMIDASPDSRRYAGAATVLTSADVAFHARNATALLAGSWTS